MLWSYKNTSCAQRKQNNDFIQQFILFPVSLGCMFTKVPRRIPLSYGLNALFYRCPYYISGPWCYVLVAPLFLQVQKALGLYQKYLNVCSEHEWRSYMFGMTWGWVINDSVFYFINYPFQTFLARHIFNLHWFNTIQVVHSSITRWADCTSNSLILYALNLTCRLAWSPLMTEITFD